MLSNSLTLGIYLRSPNETGPQPIGMARMITDYTTFSYLTDVYIQSSYRALGLGKWLIRCCREIVLEMPNLRFMLLLTGTEKAQKLYREELGMQTLGGNDQSLVCMAARRTKLADASAAGTSGPVA